MKPARLQSRPAGFTLIEIVIAMAVAVIVLLAVILASNVQQRAFYDGQRLRAAQGNARGALVYLQQKLPLAGWGMDPSFAIDFGFYGSATNTCPPEMSPCARDSTSNADELVFYARNAAYWVPANTATGPYAGTVWNLSAVSSSTVDLDARAGDVFPAGQILQAVCPGTLNYAYFTVGTTTTVTAASTVTVPLAAVDVNDPFKRQDVATAMVGCRVFQVDRYRLHVRPVPRPSGGYAPYLVLDRGIDANGDGLVDDKDEVIVAEGVETIQVAYELANPALGSAGAQPGTAITFSTANGDQTVTGAAGPDLIARTAFPGNAPASGQTVYAPSSFFRYGFSDAMRQTFHQANIRAVQVALVTRSPDPAPTTRSNVEIDSTFRLLNQSGAPSWITGGPKLASGTDGYQRVTVTTTVDLPNMTVRSIPGF